MKETAYYSAMQESQTEVYATSRRNPVATAPGSDFISDRAGQSFKLRTAQF